MTAARIPLIAAGALLAAMLLTPSAYADNGSWVCALIMQGVTVPEIAEQLEGDPAVSRYQIEQALWTVVDQQCLVER